MNKLETYKDLAKEIVGEISYILDLEYAIFDTKANLLVSTDTYLKRKGTSVHAPSIEEVIRNNNVLVNKPGYMESCIGCRFRECCPATIELLNCIKIKNSPIGVVALTSFSKSGHNKVLQNIDGYTKILDNLTNMIAGTITYKDSYTKMRSLEETLQGVLNISGDGLIITDDSGYVTYSSPNATKLFSLCDLYTLSLDHIFPEHINNSIMRGERISNKPVRIDNQNLFLNCWPIVCGDQFSGTIIRLSLNTPKKSTWKLSKKKKPDYGFESIKGKSPSILKIKSRAQKIVNSTSTVFLSGETGTGKGLLARALHYESVRAAHPFITVNCACIPPTLFESELFGYEEGAFTGAKKGGKPGMFELAQNGTIFLDEIGAMPLAMQPKLLEVVQEHTIERIGGTSSISLNIRIIAATNKRPEVLIEQNKLREDLYYRLNVIPIHLPALRERKGDVNILCYEFLKKYNTRLRKNVCDFSPDVLELFSGYPWPGNVRELENAIEYALNMTDESITLKDIPPKYLKTSGDDSPSIKHKMESIECEMIKSALDKYGWDVKGKTAAAKHLGMGLRTLYRKLKNYEDMEHPQIFGSKPHS